MPDARADAGLSSGAIADAKHRRLWWTAAGGRLCHLLPQGEKGGWP